jgi:hypothetical protein
MKLKNEIIEALESLENTKNLLEEKAGKDGDFYTNGKYVSKSCKIAWSAVLVALNKKMKTEGIKIATKDKSNIDFYREYLTKKNVSILKYLNSAYNLLYLYGGNERELSLSNTQTGLKFAKKIIVWCK